MKTLVALFFLAVTGAPLLNAQQPAPAPTAAIAKPVATFKGNGDKTCDPFVITSEEGFTVEFQTSAKYLGINIHRVGERHQVADAHLNAPGSDHTFVPAGAGKYYISVVTLGEFTITVRQ